MVNIPEVENGTIIIRKVTNAGGTGFAFTDVIEPPNTFSLDANENRIFNDIPAGLYTVTEEDPSLSPGGFFLAHISCNDTNSSVDLPGRTATIQL